MNTFLVDDFCGLRPDRFTLLLVYQSACLRVVVVVQASAVHIRSAPVHKKVVPQKLPKTTYTERRDQEYRQETSA